MNSLVQKKNNFQFLPQNIIWNIMKYCNFNELYNFGLISIKYWILFKNFPYYQKPIYINDISKIVCLFDKEYNNFQLLNLQIFDSNTAKSIFYELFDSKKHICDRWKNYKLVLNINLDNKYNHNIYKSLYPIIKNGFVYSRKNIQKFYKVNMFCNYIDYYYHQYSHLIPNLNILQINYYSFQKLDLYNDIKELHIQNCYSLNTIPRIDSLEKLKISNIRNINSICDLKNLKELYINNIKLLNLYNLDNLEILNITSCFQKFSIEYFPKLKHLIVKDCMFFKNIDNRNKLDSLSIMNCPNYTDNYVFFK